MSKNRRRINADQNNRRQTPNARLLRMESLETRELLSATGASELPINDGDTALISPNALSCVAPLELVAPPSDLAAESYDYDRARLTWSPSRDVFSYTIERSLDDGETWSELQTSVVPHALVEIEPGATNLFRVYGDGDLGASPYSEPVEFEADAIPAPSDLVLNRFDLVSVELTWSANNPGSQLRQEIERSLDGGTTWSTLITEYLGTSWLDRNLPLGATATYRVVNVTPGGRRSAPSNLETETLPFSAPNPPEFIIANIVAEGIVLVEWTSCPGATAYQVERSLDGIEWTFLADNIAALEYTDATAPTDAPLYRARAVNAAGYSDYTDVATPQLAAIRLLWAEESTPTSTQLRWFGASDAVRYLVERSDDGANWETLTTTDVGAQAWRDETLEPESSYQYRVTALAGGASSQPALILLTTPAPAPEDAPTLTATSISPTEIALAWSLDEAATNYLVQRSLDGLLWETLEVVDEADYVDGELHPNATYYYRVAATNESGASPFSETATATTPLLEPAPPETPRARPIATDSIILFWSPSADAYGYTLERSDDDGVTWTTLVDSARQLDYLDEDLTANTQYRYRLAVTAANGVSPYSSELVAQTCGAVATPAEFSVTATGTTSLSLEWSNVAGAAYYELERASEFESWRPIAQIAATTGATSYEYLDSGLTIDTVYYYSVRAVDGNGVLSPCAEEDGRTDATPPTAVDELEIEALASGDVYLEWTPTVDASCWTIERSTDATNWTTLVADREYYHYYDEDVAPLTGYYYRVTANNRAGSASPSDPYYIETAPAADQYEPNDDPLYIATHTSLADLGLLTSSTTLSNLTYVDDDDYFRFETNGLGGANHSVTLSYGGNASGLTFALLNERFETIATESSNAISLTGLGAGVYYVKVYASDATVVTFVPSYSLTIAAPYVPIVKTAPSVTTCAPTSTSAISLTWTSPAGVESYLLERSTDALTWATLDAALTETSYVDEELASNVLYYYRASAFYADDATPYVSTVVSARTLIPDDELLPNDSITEVVAQGARYANGGFLGALTDSISFDPLALPRGDEDWFAFDLTSYRADASITAQYSNDGDAIALQLYDASNQLVRNASLVDSELVLSLTGLAAGRYYARVYASANAGNPEYSLVFEPGSPELGAPTNVSATLLSTNAVSLAWQGDGGAEYYEVQRTTASAPTDDDWTTIASGIVNSNYVDSSAQGSTTYRYRIRECREGSYSNFTTSATITPNRTQPATPTGVYAERFENDYAIITWDPVPNAKSYTVQRSASNGQAWANFSPTTGTEFKDTTFVASRNYLYRVRANGYGDLGSSAYSAGVPAVRRARDNGIDASNDVALATYSVDYNPSASVVTGAIVAGLSASGKTAHIVSAPQTGTATLNGSTGAWSYAPPTPVVVNGVTAGDATIFAVEVVDANSDHVADTFVVLESPDVAPSPAPVQTVTARADAFTVVNTTTAGYASAILLDPMANDGAPTGSTLSIVSASLSNPAAGALAISSDFQKLEFTPNANYTGVVSIAYRIEDQHGAGDSITSTLTIVAAPSELSASSLLEDGAFVPSSIGTNASGSHSYALTASSVVAGVSCTTTLSVDVFDVDGVYRYSSTKAWSYQYVENGVSYSGNFTSEYAYSLSAARESVKLEVHSYDSINSSSVANSGVCIDTRDYVYIEQTIGNATRSETFDKKTSNYTGKTTSVARESQYGLDVAVISNRFVSSFEDSLQFKRTINGSTSGLFAINGRETISVEGHGFNESPITDSSWNGGLCATRNGAKTVTITDSSQVQTTYYGSGNWNSNGWSSASGSGITNGSGTKTVSLSSSGTTSRSTYGSSSETRAATGTFSESSSTQTQWDETVNYALSTTGWNVSSGAGGGSITQSSNYNASWSGSYQRGGLLGTTSGGDSSVSLMNKSYRKGISNGDWVITSGSGTESGETTQSSLDNVGNYDATAPALKGESNMPTLGNDSRTLTPAPGESVAFLQATTTELRQREDRVAYSATSSWTNGDWLVVGTGEEESTSRVISETVGRNGTYSGANGESGSTASFYQGTDASDHSLFATSYDATTETWNTVSGLATNHEISNYDLTYSGSGDKVDANVTSFFDGDATVQGSGVSYESELTTTSRSVSDQHLEYALANGELVLTTNSYWTDAGNDRDVRYSSRDGDFSRGSDSWTLSASASSDSATARDLRGDWNGASWTTSGFALNYSNSDEENTSNWNKGKSDQSSLFGAQWNTTSTSTSNQTQTEQNTEYYYTALGATGEWSLVNSASVTSPLSLPAFPAGSSATFSETPVENELHNSFSATSTKTSSSTGALIQGVYGGVFYGSGSSSSSSTETNTETRQMDSVLQLSNGALEWHTTGEDDESMESNGSSNVSWSKKPSGIDGLETTTKTESDVKSMTLKQTYDSNLLEAPTTNGGWSYTQGSYSETHNESTTVDTQYSKSMPSRPVAFGRNVNFSVVAGKSELDSLSWNLALVLTPGKDIAWALSATQSNANVGEALSTTSMYEEYRSAPMEWTEPTTAQNYGGSGLTYIIDSQTFSQSFRVETSLDGGAVHYSYAQKPRTNQNDPIEYDWVETGREGVIREKTRSTYSASSAGSYAKGDMSGTFSDSESDLYETETIYYLTTHKGTRSVHTYEGGSTSYNESGTQNGGTQTDSFSSSGSSDISITYSLQFEGDVPAATLDDDWTLESFHIIESDNHEFSNNYIKTETIDAPATYVSATNSATLDSFEKKSVYSEKDDYHYKVNYKIERRKVDLTPTEPEQATNPTAPEPPANPENPSNGGGASAPSYEYVTAISDGTVSRDYKRKNDVAYVASGTATATSLGFTNSGDVARSWGSLEQEKIAYVAYLHDDGSWSLDKPEPRPTQGEDGEEQRGEGTGQSGEAQESTTADPRDVADGKIVGLYETGTYDKYTFDADESDATHSLSYSYIDDVQTTTGHYKRFKKSAFGEEFLVDSDAYEFNRDVCKWDFEQTNTSTWNNSGRVETIKTVARRGVDTNIETKRYQDALGVWHTVAPSDSIGTAYSYESLSDVWTQPYSRSYDSTYNGLVAGNDTYDEFQDKSINANVYYDPQNQSRWYQGETKYTSTIKSGYSGTGSYSSSGVTSTTSSFSESMTQKAKETTNTKFNTRVSNAPISVDYQCVVDKDATYSYEYDYEVPGTYYSNDVDAARSETSSSTEGLNYHRRTTATGDVEEAWSAWTANGDGERTDVATEVAGLETWAHDYEEDYDFDFTVEWSRPKTGAFSRSPITAVENEIDGFYTTTFIADGDERVKTQTLNSPIDSTTFSSQVSGNFAADQVRNLRFSPIDSTKAKEYGASEISSNWTIVLPGVTVPTDATFSCPGRFGDFSLDSSPGALQPVEWIPLNHDFLQLTTLPPFEIDALTSLLSDSDRSSVRRTIKSDIEAKYASEASASVSAWDMLFGAGKFVFDSIIGESIYLGIDAYKNMLATGADPLTALYVAVGTAVADQVGIVSLSNAVTGEDLATGRQLSAGERWMEGIGGAFDLVSAATGGLGALKSGIRATGQCERLGKFFTDCCFTEEVEFLVYQPTITVVANDKAVENEEDVLKNDEATDETEITDVLCEEDVVEANVAEELALALVPETAAIESAVAYEKDEQVAEENEADNTPTLHEVSRAAYVKENDKPYVALGALALAALGGAVVATKTSGKSRRDEAFGNYCDEEALDDEGDAFINARAKKSSSLQTVKAKEDGGVTLLAEPKSQPVVEAKMSRKTRRRNSENARRVTFFTSLSICLLSLFAMAWLLAQPQTTHERQTVVSVQYVKATQAKNAENVSVPIAEVVEETPEIETVPNAPVVEINGETNDVDPILDVQEQVTDAHIEPAQLSEPRNVVTEIAPTSFQTNYEIRAKKISEAEIGDRTPGVNPEGNDGSDESLFLKQKHCVYSLVLKKENGSLCYVKLLRPDDWLDSEDVQICRNATGQILDDVDFITDEMIGLDLVGDYAYAVWLELPEMGCVGWAKVVDVEEFQYVPGIGNLVTGTFKHTSDDVIDLVVEGQTKPIGVTTTHPFWSVDRQEFAPAGDLIEGERLLLFSGDTARVLQKLPRPGPQDVYNIEVFGEHVYLVTPGGVIVHNGCRDKDWTVYISKVEKRKDEITGEVIEEKIKDIRKTYIGRSVDPKRRASEHHSKRDIMPVEGLIDIPYKDARCAEQILKERFELHNYKTANKINGMSERKKNSEEYAETYKRMSKYIDEKVWPDLLKLIDEME